MPGFQEFIRERKYLHNVTDRTLEWYENSLRWLPNESPSQAELNDVVIRMRELGRKATGCNCAIRAINAYLKWAGSPHKIRPLKEPRLVLPTFTDEQVRRIVQWKPKADSERRLHLLMLLMFDTGCRISEALALKIGEVDLDNLLVQLDGKGRKQRVVPFSFELRKALQRYCKYRTRPEDLLFATRTRTPLSRNNVLRDVKLLCKSLGFAPPVRTLHATRHTFALGYLRRGGSVFHLQKVLGHSSLEMTRRYANLGTVDLQAVHERVSLLKMTGSVEQKAHKCEKDNVPKNQ